MFFIVRQCNISIHAPREGSDEQGPGGLLHLPISIHAPREGSDCTLDCNTQEAYKFLSTLPARGATLVVAY